MVVNISPYLYTFQLYGIILYLARILTDLYPYNDGRACTINTTTGLVYNDMSNEGRWFEILDGVNCTEYKLSPNNDGSSGRIPTSVPFQVFQHVYNSLSVCKLVFMYVLNM